MNFDRHLLTILSTGLLMLLSGCDFSGPIFRSVEGNTQSAQQDSSSQPNVTDPFREAVNKATEAAQLTQAAKTPGEWSKVADIWQEAIRLMQAVPESSTNYQTAQQKAAEYQGYLEYAQRNKTKMSNVAQQPDQPVRPTLPISQQAAQLRMGMTYKEVVALLGRMPDTVVNDQIRQELGEPRQGHDLISFEWKNDNPDCQPVIVDFRPSSMTTNGWDEGRTCPGASIFNEPFGKACSETTLCKLRED